MNDSDSCDVNGTDQGRLVEFSRAYANVHGYVSVCVCLFGIVTNLFNITGELVVSLMIVLFFIIMMIIIMILKN